MLEEPPLLLVHFDGYSLRWLMWLHRTRDAHRLRPLPLEGPSPHFSGGSHTWLTWQPPTPACHGTCQMWQPPGSDDWFVFDAQARSQRDHSEITVRSH